MAQNFYVQQDFRFLKITENDVQLENIQLM